MVGLRGMAPEYRGRLLKARSGKRLAPEKTVAAGGSVIQSLQLETPMRLALLALLHGGLYGGCAARRIDALERENLQLRIELQQAQAQLSEAQPATPSSARPTPPDEEAAAAALAEARRLDDALRFDEARAAYTLVRDTWPESRSAATAVRRLKEMEVMGQPAPPLVVDRWLQGEAPVSTPVQVLLFWEEWCPHCRNGLPEMSARAAVWAAKGVQVIGLTRLSKQSTEERVASFYAEHRIAFPTALISNDVSAAYAVTAIPAAAVVRDGVVIWRGHPARLTEGLLERLVEKR